MVRPRTGLTFPIGKGPDRLEYQTGSSDLTSPPAASASSSSAASMPLHTNGPLHEEMSFVAWDGTPTVQMLLENDADAFFAPPSMDQNA